MRQNGLYGLAMGHGRSCWGGRFGGHGEGRCGV